MVECRCKRPLCMLALADCIVLYSVCLGWCVFSARGLTGKAETCAMFQRRFLWLGYHQRERFVWGSDQ